jgi:hypothetical protein
MTTEDAITPADGPPPRSSEQLALPIAVPMPRFDANRIESRWAEMPAETVGDRRGGRRVRHRALVVRVRD